jgi:NOL1/NOP2/sun family putative RNA methylase
MTKEQTYSPKPLFLERMKRLFDENEEEVKKFLEIVNVEPINSIRCNTIKISPEKLKLRLEEKGWKIKQPFKEHPEIMIIESELSPGELGKSIEHLLGYYYVQEISSMLPMLALKPEREELVLDLCAAPGSKTTQAAAYMENLGTIIANDKDIVRISILSANLERCGVTNTITTRNDGVQLCEKLDRLGMRFDKIFIDAPCSGEGTLRSGPKTFLIWNIKMIEKLSRIQKKLVASTISLLKKGGEMIYSTCTHSPEENERVVSFLLENFPVKIEKIELPLKCRQGIKKWGKEEFAEGIENCCRVYPQDNNTEGFFLAKLRKIE